MKQSAECNGMALSVLFPIQNFASILQCLSLRYRHHTCIRNPAHQSVACASTYCRTSIQMGLAGSCQHAKSLIEAPVFGFNFVKYGVDNKLDL
jgi:hypothetical protein